MAIETTFAMEVRVSGKGMEQQGIRVEFKACLPSIPGENCRFVFPASPDENVQLHLSPMEVAYNVKDGTLEIYLDPDGAFDDLDSVYSFAAANGCENPTRWRLVEEDEV